VLVSVVAAAAFARAASADAPSPAACIHTMAEARYGAYGYNHIVHVANSCAVPAECLVSTDVNPEQQKVSLPPRGAADVNTFLGSPAREFKPKVTCKMLAR
jgi:hypothetical protein